MAQIAVDFGTCNTVLARFNETLQRAETIQIPAITSEMEYCLNGDGNAEVVHVIPSLIHYSESETLIGDQVVSRGLAEHGDTLRWMKRSIAHGVARRKRTAQGHKSPAEAGEEFLSRVLRYASDQLSLEEDEFTFTAPVEAFEDFQDWLRKLCESLGIRRVRLLDEPTACILGYQGAARQDDRFVVFDFGGGTLDVSAVRIDLSSVEDKKALQMGQAGLDLGGMDIDRWIFEDFCARHRLGDYEQRELEAVILRQAEEGKKRLSDPREDEAEVNVLNDLGRSPRLLRTTYTRSCPDCERGRPGNHGTATESCLGCLLCGKEFARQIRETVDRALENAAVKSGMRRDDVAKVLLTGGTSLVPCARQIMHDLFRDRLHYERPFDAVVRGAVRGLVAPILQHDYAIESYNQDRKDYEFKPLFKIGQEYPTERDAVKFWAKGSYDGMTRIGLKIFEVSRMQRRSLDVALVDADGALRDESRVRTDNAYICLNSENPTFILADPPVNLQRDQKRFLASFWVDGNRRLLVTVLDNLVGKTLLKDHPVVRL